MASVVGACDDPASDRISASFSVSFAIHGLRSWPPDICAAVSTVMLGKKVVIGCVVYACIVFRLVELVLPKVGGIVLQSTF